MITNLGKLITVQLPPILTLLSASLILANFLSPVPIHHESISLINVYSVPGVGSSANLEIIPRKLPRAAAAALIGRAAADTGGLSLTFGLLGSCNQAGDLQCTGDSLTPVYDLSSLPSNLRGYMVTAPPQTSPHWTLISILALFVFFLLTALPSVPRVPERLINVTLRPSYSRTAAWIGIIGWAAGVITVIVVRVNFDDAVSTFNMMAGGQKATIQASLGNGFTLLWLGYALAVPSLICTLFKVQLEAKSV